MAAADHSMAAGETTSSISPVGNVTHRSSKASLVECERECADLEFQQGLRIDEKITDKAPMLYL